jgi:hypothetical protein
MADGIPKAMKSELLIISLNPKKDTHSTSKVAVKAYAIKA